MNKQEEPGKLTLWGVGDQGIRVISSLPEDIRRLVKPVAVDSDIQSLICAPTIQKIRIEPKADSGPGIRADPEKLEKAFRASEEKIREKLSPAKTLIIVGGLGGGVASALIPALCRCARQLKIYTLVFATRPFAFEGKKKYRIFKEAREKIEESGVGLACFSLDRLVGKVEDDTPHQEVFHRCDRILMDAVECAISYLAAPPEQGGDRAALGNIFAGAGEAIMGVEMTAGPQDLVKSAKAALSSLSLTAAELAGVRGVLIQIDGPGPIPFGRVKEAIGAISQLLGEETDVLYTVTRQKKADERISFRLLAAGISPPLARAEGSPIPVTLNRDGHRPRQREMDFDKFTRGLFADSEPTSREGEDLDIPTFIRKGIQLDGEGGR
jgi:cell division protein FtsZ